MEGEQPRRSEQRRYDDIRVQGVLFGFHYAPPREHSHLLRISSDQGWKYIRSNDTRSIWNTEIRVFSYFVRAHSTIAVDSQVHGCTRPILFRLGCAWRSWCLPLLVYFLHDELCINAVTRSRWLITNKLSYTVHNETFFSIRNFLVQSRESQFGAQ